MTDAVLTNEQTLKLLLELATNDGFRRRYEEKPAAALLEIGVPAATIANMSAACLVQCTLKPKSDFLEAHQQLQNNTFAAAQSMAVPNLRLSTKS
ncbi:MAG TPA: NHLP-related RiPP peptide [Dokdonella sp.]|nr:NHLP-related RiPP peptide [Dokdonella sp.]